jgi:tetratricopeptide (TPR) repeat protein
MPFLGVMRFETTGTPGERVVAATSLLEKLREGLSEFDAINVVPETPGGDPRVDYRLIGFIDHHDDGTATLRFRLIDVRSNNLVWTRAFNRLAAARDRAATEDSIVSEVANTLLPPYGVLRSYARGKSLAGGSGDTRYQCILWGSEAIRSYDLADYNRARSCLETATAKDLSFSDGFAYLAILYNREFIQGLEPGAGLGPPLDRALQTARRAVELKPNSARAYQALAGALFYRREFPASFAAFDKAMALNKYDSTIPIDYGGRLIAVGEVDRGMSLLRGAMKDGGEVRASWQRFSLFLGYYLKDDIAEATQQATLMANDTFLFGLAARTIAAVRNGNIDAARQTADRIIALRPAWRDDPGTELYRMIPNPAIVAKLTRDLAEAGVGRPKQGSGQ